MNTYSEAISQYAESKFDRYGIDTILNARVKEVGKDHVTYTTKTTDGKTEEHVIPCGFALWSTGIGKVFLYGGDAKPDGLTQP